MNKQQLKRIIKEELTKMLSEEQSKTPLQLKQGVYTFVSDVDRVDDGYNPYRVSHIVDPEGNVVLHHHSFDDTDGVGPASKYFDAASGRFVAIANYNYSFRQEVQRAVDALEKMKKRAN